MRYHKTLLAIAVILALSAPTVLAGDHGEKKTSDEDLTRIEGEIYRVYTRTAIAITHELHRGDDRWMLKKHHEGHGMM